MHLPQWLLLLSGLLAAAVLLGLLARRVRLPFTVVLAVVGFLAAWLGDPLGFESLRTLTAAGLLPETITRRAAEVLAAELGAAVR